MMNTRVDLSQRISKFRTALSWGIILLLSCQLSVWADDKDGGFGVNKSAVTFIFSYPPKLLVTQRTFGIHFSGTEALRPTLTTALRQLMSEAKPGIAFMPDGGELRMLMDVVHDYASRNFTRKLQVEKVDEKTKEKTTVEETHRFVEVQSAFAASYEIQDWTGGSPTSMATGKFSTPRYSREIDLTASQEKPLSEMTARQDGIAKLIAQLQPTFSKVDVRVEAILGKVDDYLKSGITLAERNNWRGAYDSWNAVPAFTALKAEAYRVYNLGVANEALGHEAFARGEKVDETLRYLSEARKLYEQASRLKPDEKFFNHSWRNYDPPLERVNKAIGAYRAWKERKEALLQASRGRADDLLSDTPGTAGGTRAVGGAKPSSSANNQAISNDDVIEMAQAKASDEFILETIASTATTNFDLSVQGRIKLLKNGVSEKVIRGMQQRQPNR